MKILIGIAGSLLFSQAAIAQTLPQKPPEWIAWSNCVASNAQKFSSGFDDAFVVARAAVIPCRPLLEIFLNKGSKKPPEAMPPSELSELRTITKLLRDQYIGEAYDQALVIVVNARVGRSK